MITIHCIHHLTTTIKNSTFPFFSVNYHVYHFYMKFNLRNCMLVSGQHVDVVLSYFLVREMLQLMQK